MRTLEANEKQQTNSNQTHSPTFSNAGCHILRQWESCLTVVDKVLNNNDSVRYWRAAVWFRSPSTGPGFFAVLRATHCSNSPAKVDSMLLHLVRLIRARPVVAGLLHCIRTEWRSDVAGILAVCFWNLFKSECLSYFCCSLVLTSFVTGLSSPTSSKTSSWP